MKMKRFLVLFLTAAITLAHANDANLSSIPSAAWGSSAMWGSAMLGSGTSDGFGTIWAGSAMWGSSAMWVAKRRPENRETCVESW